MDMDMDMDMDRGQEIETSQLFLLRLWTADTRAASDKEKQVHGKVQHALCGEAASFNDWPAVMQLLVGTGSSVVFLGQPEVARHLTIQLWARCLNQHRLLFGALHRLVQAKGQSPKRYSALLHIALMAL